ncbi:hypothetical protein [Streptacidiphilus sp. EB103A]|uniref:hypothetical protein n=1 Tax=Streptacidiphilus sp. EB103A TaxID=3156275 RepID=UPI003515D398
MVLTRVHLDYCGYLPGLVREGFRGPGRSGFRRGQYFKASARLDSKTYAGGKPGAGRARYPATAAVAQHLQTATSASDAFPQLPPTSPAGADLTQSRNWILDATVGLQLR